MSNSEILQVLSELLDSEKIITLENLSKFKELIDALYYKKTDTVANAKNADKATNDSAGNNIVNSYARTAITNIFTALQAFRDTGSGAISMSKTGSDYGVYLHPADNMTSNKDIRFQDKSGYVAMLDDIPVFSSISLVDSLPTANLTEYNKHLLYLYSGELYYISADEVGIDGQATGLVLPSNTYEMAYATVGTDIYVIGGQTGESGTSGVLTRIVKFDTVSKQVTTLANTLPSRRHSASAAAFGTDIYVFGGSQTQMPTSDTVLNQVIKIDTLTGEVTTLSTSFSTGRLSATAVTSGSYIYVFGGRGGKNGNTYYNEVYRFNPANQQLTRIAFLPFSVCDVGAAAIGTKIYLFGGTNSSGNFKNTISIFDTETNTTETISTVLPANMSNISTIVKGNIIYGLFASENSVGTHEFKFDINDYSVTELSNDNSLYRLVPATGIVNNVVYVLGGSGHNEITRVLFTYEYSYKPVVSRLFDNTPTDNSANLVSSGNIKAYVDNSKQDLEEALTDGSVTVSSATNATKAAQDAAGRNIQTTYATKNEVGTVQTNLNSAIAEKQNTLIAGTNITIVDNVISATGGGGTIEYMTDAEVDALFVTSFATANWAAIAKISEDGLAENYFSVGDEKTIELTTGEQVTLVILGFNHDDLTSGGKAGITIGMKNLLATTYPMNTTATNVGGWGDSGMRTSTMATLLTQLPSDLQSVIKQVYKRATAGNQSEIITTPADKLWLFAEVEIDGTTTAGYADEGEQYEYWKTVKDGTVADDRKKYLSNGSGSAKGWWLRSPSVSSNYIFRCIYSSGGVTGISANNAYGVCFGFCI